jgi:hypothetical protein
MSYEGVKAHKMAGFSIMSVLVPFSTVVQRRRRTKPPFRDRSSHSESGR